MPYDNPELEICRLHEIIADLQFRAINDNPCPVCGAKPVWMLCESGAEALCTNRICGWTSLDPKDQHINYKTQSE